MFGITLNRQNIFQPTVLLAVALMGVIVMMILPVPAWILDVGLALSFALAILMLTVALFIERPLDFSAFPTILLASLMLRLSLNVSSTKLIIGQGHTGTDAAGSVIEGFANFIMSGNLLLGVVIFGVLLIVNFMVITKGAGRMAEVGARFALDGMPGRQMAIDADMAAGALTHAEAKQRRETELAETTFFGSLDGASKFVKGDAIAGLLITVLNIVMGLVMGVFFHDMPVGKAFETYAILTVGDGLVGQIPAVIISVATALLLSRGGTKGSADAAFFSQLGRYPAALATVGVVMGLFAVVPGMPFIPFMIAAIALGYFAWKVSRPKPAKPITPTTTVASKRPLGDILDFDEIHLEFSPDLVEMVLNPLTGLDSRIFNMRNHVAARYGVILPEIRLTDAPELNDGQYRIRVQGVERVTCTLMPYHCLVLLSDGIDAPDGVDVKEPVYGTPARWISEEDQETAVLNGLTVVSAAEVLATHLLEIIRSHLPELISLRGLRRLLDEFVNVSDSLRSAANRRLLDDMIPDKVPMDLMMAVLRLLLEEQVSIRNLPLILESIAEARSLNSAEAICEHARHRLSFQLIAEHKRADGTVPLIQLAPEWELAFISHQAERDRGTKEVSLPPEQFAKLANNIVERVNRLAEKGISAAIITSTLRRRFLKNIVQAKGLKVSVLSYDELSVDAKASIVGVVAA